MKERKLIFPVLFSGRKVVPTISSSLLFPSFFLPLPHLVCHFDSNTLLDVARFSLSAAPRHAKTYHIYCLWCVLDPVSYSLPHPQNEFSPAPGLLYLAITELFIAVGSPGSVCVPSAIIPCQHSSVAPPVCTPLKASVLSSASLP